MSNSRVCFSYMSDAGAITLSQRDKYAFKVINKSVTENWVLNPFWEAVTTLFPMWLAPNLVTLLGFVFMIVMHFLLWYCYPDISKHGYFQLYSAIVAACMFIYQTMDGCDGKQARRTKSSSPLGECVDHGCDAWCVTTIAFSLCVAIGMTAPNNSMMELVHISLWSAFMASHWEHRYTDVFYLGYVTAGDAIFIIILANVINIVPGGIAIWTMPVMYTDLLFPRAILVQECVFHIFSWVCLVAAIRCFFVVHAALQTKKASMVQPILDWIPVVTVLSSFAFWIRQDRPFFNEHYMWFNTLYGLIFSTVITTMDVARVTRDAIPFICPQYVISIGSALFGVVNMKKQYVDPLTYLQCATILNLLHYLFFVQRLISKFCSILNIYAFQIKQ